MINFKTQSLVHSFFKFFINTISKRTIVYFVSVTGPIPPSNTPSVIHLDVTNSTDSTMSSGNSAWLTMISNLTRKQLSNISVPQVSVNPFQPTSIVSVCGSFNETDPLELHERPPEIVLEQG